MRVIRIPYGVVGQYFSIEDLYDVDFQSVKLHRTDVNKVWLEFEGGSEVGISWVISAEEVEALILVLQLLQKEIKDNE